MKNLYNFYKAHKDRVKSIKLIPNVSEYLTETTGLHLTALLYGIEKMIRKVYVTKLNKGEYNKYLEKQMLRLSKYAVEGEIRKYLWLSKILITKSISFRLKFMNEVDRKWYLRKPKEIDRTWRRVSRLCETMSSNLVFKRVWITDPGKTETYTRPLGVPTMEWRIYSRMRLEIMERWFKGRGKLQTWQHGGRSGKGVLSCYKEVLPKYLRYKNIMEFDIKGFFNNVSHERIISLFKELFPQKIKGFLTTKPSGYTLPPKEDDIASKLYEEGTGEATKALTYTGSSNYGRLGRVIGFTAKSDIEFNIMWRKDNNLPIPEMGTEMPNWEDTAVIINKEGLLEVIARKGLVEQYKTLMDTKRISPFTTKVGDEIREEDRAVGRDNWKGLGQEGKGVPQGLGTSPFLSTLLTDVYLREIGQSGNLTMYMDDGLLFSNNDLTEVYERLKIALAEIGLEVEPKKTSVVKSGGRWLKTLKFLGMRFDGNMCELKSDTRAGARKAFPRLLTITEMLQKYENLNSAEFKELQQAHYGRYRDIDTRAWKDGLKSGFLGLLIADSQYKGAKSSFMRKVDIASGVEKAWRKATSSPWSLIWQNSQKREQTLTNISSIACEEFLLIKTHNLTVRRFERLKRGGIDYKGEFHKRLR